MTDDESLIQTAATVSQKLTKFLVDVRVHRVKHGLNPDKSPDGDPLHLSHYTTADGLQGIIQNGNIRASCAYRLCILSSRAPILTNARVWKQQYSWPFVSKATFQSPTGSLAISTTGKLQERKW
jgi:hypothetical protein